MFVYYLLLIVMRFHNDPRLGMLIARAGPVLVTPVKIVGLFTVLSALFVPRPKDAAPRLPNLLGPIFAACALVAVLEAIVFWHEIPSDDISALLSYTLMFMATRVLVRTPERMSKSVRTVVLASALASLWLFKWHFVEHVDRPNGLEGDGNYEALALVTGIPLALWMARQEVFSSWRRIGLGCAALMGAGALLTKSRAGLIALAVVGLALVKYSRRKVLALALFTVTALFIVAFAPSGLAQRFQGIRLTGTAENGDEVSSRLHYELIKAGLRMIESHPVVGVGLNRFKSVAPAYNPSVLAWTGQSHIAHNTYVQIAAESGLPTLGLFFALVVIVARNCRSVRRSPVKELAELAKAMQIGLLGFGVAAASVTATYVGTFWVIVFWSQNLREIAQAASSPGKTATRVRVERSRLHVRIAASRRRSALRPLAVEPTV